jgi:alpha-tubulin suppressor-like RCC1 family protein
MTECSHVLAIAVGVAAMGCAPGEAVRSTEETELASTASGREAPSDPVLDVALGERHTCIIERGGSVRCWGANEWGQLGGGTIGGDGEAMVEVIGLAPGVRLLASHVDHSCAINAAGGLHCWGYDVFGQLGYRESLDAPSNGASGTPMAVVGLASGVRAAATSHTHTCALTISGGVKCWGNNDSGQLGDGTYRRSGVPRDVVGFAAGASAIGVHDDRSCALTDGGVLKCWGSPWPLGPTPAAVDGLDGDVVAFVVGAAHACALTKAGAVACWGENRFGQIGDASTSTAWRPALVDGLSSGVKALAVGNDHTCAILATAIKCWGRNDLGQLGDGTRQTRHVPAEVVGLDAHSVAGMAAATNHTCARTHAGQLYCWGENRFGQLGNGSINDSSRPILVPAEMTR